MQKIVETYFNIGHDASASIIITLIVFILGYLFTVIAFTLNNYFKRRSNRKVIFANYKSLNKSLKGQETGLLNTIASFDIVRNTPWVYNKAELFQIAVFKEMGYAETFKTFFLGFENIIFFNKKKRALKNRAYIKLWANINLVEFWSTKSFSDFYPILDKYNQFGDSRNNAVNRLRQFWESLFSNAKNDLPREYLEYIKKLDGLIVKFSKIPGDLRVTPFTAHRKLVLPIRILNRQYPKLPFIRDFNDIALEASTYYHEMELFLRHTRDQYKEYYFTIRTARRLNKKIIQILS